MLKKTVAIARPFYEKSDMEILPGDIKFLYLDVLQRQALMAIRSPLTNEWIEFEISDKASLDTFLSRDYSQVIEYYLMMKGILERARDFRPFNHTITALCDEESLMFGVKAPPRKTYTPRRRQFDTLGNGVY
jgi:hypothetical protein